MKLHPYAFAIICVLAAPVSTAGDNPSPAGASRVSSKDGKKPEPVDVRSLLEKGRASAVLPEGMVIRFGACLGDSDLEVSGKRVPDELRESWEFTSHQVHRVMGEQEKDNAKPSRQRVESRPFDTKSICIDLLEGKAIEISARKGNGPEIGFIGTSYHAGSREIEVLLNGEAILTLLETNGPFLHLYRETDARAFGALYERLASQARVLFKSDAAESK